MTDQELVERAAEGDVDAFTQLVDSRRDRVFRIARHLVGDDELARDIAQDVFFRLFRVIHRFRRGGRFDPWLHRMTIHLGIDALRRERPYRQSASLDELTGQSDTVASSQPGPAQLLGAEEVRRLFAELSKRLGRRQRAAFILREIEGLTTVEVAEVLGTSESTVRNHILQARKALQKALRERFPEYLPRGQR
ncbi:MAG TPA: RNA polymerase sigma factor [Candidatus Polarisedimenticolia bacterium]|nr:RNA polymerase sigma factor [Candidatus Polarisedimenticolia bacterium]